MLCKDAQTKMVMEVERFVERGLKAFYPVDSYARTWIESELGAVISMHAVDARLGTEADKGATLQASRRAEKVIAIAEIFLYYKYHKHVSLISHIRICACM